MQDFLVKYFFELFLCVASFGVSYILRNINTNITELQKEYRKLIDSREATRLSMVKEIAEIKEFITGQYIRRDEIHLYIAQEIQDKQRLTKRGDYD